MEKIYHIYIKDRCIYHSLNQTDFEDKWDTLKNLIDLLNTGYNKEDISYEEVVTESEVLL